MSYILDALRKAENERRLGAIPDLHGQPSAMPAAPAASNQPRLLMAGIALAALLALGVTAWLQPWKPAPARVADAAPQPAAHLPAAAEPEAPQAWIEPASAVQPDTTAAQAKPAVPPRPRSENKTVRAKPQAPAAPAPTQAAAAAPRTQAAATVMPAPLSAPSPDSQPRELPQIVIGGYLYSDNPRDRQLLVNKRLLREGEEAAPGLVLEKMMPKAAVFNYKGYRYQVNY